MDSHFDARGFSTIESLISTMVSMIALAGVLSFSQTQSSTMTAQSRQLDNQSLARSAVELFSREVRAAGSDPTCAKTFDGISAASDTLLRFTADLDGSGMIDGGLEDITYVLDASQLTVERIQDAESDTLLSGISAKDSRFRYFAADGTEIGTSGTLSAAERNAVRRVRFELAVIGDATSSSGVRISTNVNLRSRFFVKAMDCS